MQVDPFTLSIQQQVSTVTASSSVDLPCRYAECCWHTKYAWCMATVTARVAVMVDPPWLHEQRDRISQNRSRWRLERGWWHCFMSARSIARPVSFSLAWFCTPTCTLYWLLAIFTHRPAAHHTNKCLTSRALLSVCTWLLLPCFVMILLDDSMSESTHTITIQVST